MSVWSLMTTRFMNNLLMNLAGVISPADVCYGSASTRRIWIPRNRELTGYIRIKGEM